ncbi:hypothetical protein EDEG_03078 [Edhazardia aedis USNM 41457]|uniref:Uncharacterized protein n=1 Tax=Edhazardia aedis (strain USNM 41457) TaxID=1003232 RepID=J9DMB4_EDHAE|nr:hypothetical protein EDEG_03078 [Edhazardia aedis USNM 41457]|eukprot:EJW02512.1 hypothetical protein EDEG_03078 [Edhazardia aedis USNM 41457]
MNEFEMLNFENNPVSLLSRYKNFEKNHKDFCCIDVPNENQNKLKKIYFILKTLQNNFMDMFKEYDQLVTILDRIFLQDNIETSVANYKLGPFIKSYLREVKIQKLVKIEYIIEFRLLRLIKDYSILKNELNVLKKDISKPVFHEFVKIICKLYSILKNQRSLIYQLYNERIFLKKSNKDGISFNKITIKKYQEDNNEEFASISMIIDELKKKSAIDSPEKFVFSRKHIIIKAITFILVFFMIIVRVFFI